MTEAEKQLAELKANAQANVNANNPKSKKKGNQKGIESSLAIAADTQYQNGVALVRKVGEQSFLQGIEDEIENMIDAQNLDDDQVSEIAAKFQTAASKRLRPQSRQPLILPASAWLIDEEDDGDE